MKSNGSMKRIKAHEIGEGLDHGDSSLNDLLVSRVCMIVYPDGTERRAVIKQRGMTHDGEDKFFEVIEDPPYELTEEGWRELWDKQWSRWKQLGDGADSR